MKAIIRIFFAFSILYLFPGPARAQEPGATEAERILLDRIEQYVSQSETGQDYEELFDRLVGLLENPVNINSADAEELGKIIFLNEMQIYNILAYRDMSGAFVSLTELAFIDGFDRRLAELVIPFLYVGESESDGPVSLKTILRHGRSEAIVRYERLIQTKKGYTQTNDSSGQRVYPGSPDKYYLKYRFKSLEKIQAGITTEKDPGEALIPGKINDAGRSALMLSGNTPDFLSGHLQLKNMGALKSLVVGDYHLRFGQGLTLWSGYSFGKSAESVDLRRTSQGVSPFGSSDENRFFRGIAGTMNHRDLEISAFFSSNLTDAGISDLSQDETGFVTSMRETGLHRTVSEMEGKDRLRINVYGGNVTVLKRRYRAGFTASRTELDKSLETPSDTYRKFDFSGKSNANAGFDYMYLWKKAFVFGEAAVSANGGFGLLTGLTSSPHPRIETSLLYRNYSFDYQNLYSAAFGENGENINEKGLYLAAKIAASRMVTLHAYLDVYAFDWLRYNTSGPSSGNEESLQLTVKPSGRFFFYLRFYTENKTISSSDQHEPVKSWIRYIKSRYRLHAGYSVSETVSFKSRIEALYNRDEKGYRGTGWLFYHDIVWKPAHERLSLAFRYALFDTDTYNERIYAYENDVLYSFSVPAYYYKGSRVYLLLRVNPFKNLSVWCRLSHTCFLNVLSIGSGMDEINGNEKTDVKLQLRWKF
ncbi:MAG: helix-hairpin-helix domain-containing protein [Bacteroidales bacterium]|nr:helix-hairpin-helix domain-containing protein [Bacteroidales bacterium]